MSSPSGAADGVSLNGILYSDVASSKCGMRPLHRNWIRVIDDPAGRRRYAATSCEGHHGSSSDPRVKTIPGTASIFARAPFWFTPTDGQPGVLLRGVPASMGRSELKVLIEEALGDETVNIIHRVCAEQKDTWAAWCGCSNHQSCHDLLMISDEGLCQSVWGCYDPEGPEGGLSGSLRMDWMQRDEVDRVKRAAAWGSRSASLDLVRNGPGDADAVDAGSEQSTAAKSSIPVKAEPPRRVLTEEGAILELKKRVASAVAALLTVEPGVPGAPDRR